MIPAAAFDFLRGLAANNEKAWFEANRALYETAVREPVAHLVAAVTTELTSRGVPLEGDPKRSTFRLYRDTRFSKDKSPYKTNVGMVWFRQGSSKGGPGVLYCHLEPGACFVGAAFWHPEPEVLDSIRERIRVHPDRFAAVQAALASAGLPLSESEMLTRVPRGYEELKGTALDGIIRLKNFIVRRPLSDKDIQSRALPSRIVDLAEAAMPLLRFGWDAIDEVSRTE